MQKVNKKKIRVEKIIRRKGEKLYVKWKVVIVLLTVGYIKKETVWMSKYFSEPKSSGRRVKVKLDLPNYATKSDLKKSSSCC